MSYQNTGKPNGLPLSDRNKNIIADHKAGMSLDDLAKKYNLGRQYVQKLASEYKRKDRLKAEEMHIACTTRLYADRDLAIMKFIESQGNGVIKVIREDSVRKNKFYTQRAKT